MKTKTKITVRYAETDQMGIAHHSVYAVWFEAARTEFMREMGFPYAELEKMGILAPLLELHVKYGRPARYEDELLIETRLIKVTHTKLLFAYRVYDAKSERLLSQGSTLHGIVGKDLRPIRLQKVHPAFAQALVDVQEEDDS
ncbi:MAG: thioesterase family protein [Oscillospiraceae bacterium]|nr:thioesterase family protein [Oscillospiraceae bacterium]